MLSFDDYPDISARLAAVIAGERPAAHTPARPAEAAAGHPGGPPRRRHLRARARARGRRRHTPAHLRTVLRHRLDTGPGRPAEAGQRLRPAVRFCAIPRVPRRVRLPYAGRAARRGGVAGPRRGPGAGAGQRELHLLRQGPGRPAGAGEAAAAAGRGRRHRPGAGELPAAGGDPAGPGGGDRHHARAWRPTSTCRSSTPASRCCAGCAGSAPPSGSWSCSAAIRALAPEAGARSNVIVGFPGETRADVDELVRFLNEARLDAIGVFDYSDEDGTEAAGLPGKVPPPPSTPVRPAARWPRSCAPSGPRSGSARPSRCWSTAVDDGDGGGPGRAPGARRWTAPPPWSRRRRVDLAALRPGDLVRAR